MKTRLVGSLILVFALILSASISSAQQPEIEASLKAIPEAYKGKCPAVIKFEGQITVKNLKRPPLKVQYKFIRSDGAYSPIETIFFEKDGSKNVSTTWTLGGKTLPDYEGWEAIKIVYPHDKESKKAHFKIRCVEPGPHPENSVKEDCVSFNPTTAEVKNIGNSWKIVDGSQWLFDFGSKKYEAEKALRIIKHYKMNQSCFVGRPDPSFSYLLISGLPPAGPYRHGPFESDDCVFINLETLEVKNIGNSWKIVTGSQLLFDFGNKESEARQALAIIKKYRFNNSCFVGRPDPSFKYLRK